MCSAQKKSLKPTSLTVQKQKGFTVIELLITLVAMFLIFGVGMANMRSFQRRRVLEGAVGKVKGDLRLAQEMAISGVKPPDCITLNLSLLSVKFSVNSDHITYKIVGTCSNNTDYSYSSLAYNLEPDYDGVEFSGSPTVIFNTLGRGVESDITLSLEQASTGNSFDIEVTKGGEIY